MVQVKPRFCRRCGKPGPWRSPGAERCLSCDQEVLDAKKENNKPYHKARYRAWKKLELAHKEEFDLLMKIELPKARKEAAKK